MKLTTAHAEREAQLEAEVRFLRERLEEATTESAIWKRNYEAAIQTAAIFSPPDLLEILEDQSFRAYYAALK